MAQQHLQQLADSIVKYQLKSGGWPKNQDWLKGVDPKEAKAWRKTGIGGTIDNGATTTEMETLANAVAHLDRMQAEVPLWADTDLTKVMREKSGALPLASGMPIRVLLLAIMMRSP